MNTNNKSPAKRQGLGKKMIIPESAKPVGKKGATLKVVAPVVVPTISNSSASKNKSQSQSETSQVAASAVIKRGRGKLNN